MDLRVEIEIYREPRTRMVGLQPNPPDHSCDNGLLFSATYLMLLSLNVSTATWDEEKAWFKELVRQCTIQPGLIRRYPGDLGVQAHDDMIGIAWVDAGLARDILLYGKDHHYSWNTEQPGVWTLRTWFYRMGAFVPFLKSRAGFDLNWFDKLNVAVSFWNNTRDMSNDTSGRCLLFLMYSILIEEPSWLVQKALNYWRARMNTMYTYGLQDIYRIYFGADHPFAKYAPKVV